MEIDNSEIEAFGDKDYILYRIVNELNSQFNTRKQLVLKAMYSYIEHECTLLDDSSLSFFGTNSFNLVWELVCADIMDNQLNTALEQLKLPRQLDTNKYAKNLKLKDIIEKPLWTETRLTATDTLILDLITIKNDKFVIIDAKYYNTQLKFGCVPSGQPGIESVTKQYLYQLAYKKFIVTHGIDWNTGVKNCFIMPTEGQYVEIKGEVSMSMFSTFGLQNIQVRFLPADKAYDCYLNGVKLDISFLKL